MELDTATAISMAVDKAVEEAKPAVEPVRRKLRASEKGALEAKLESMVVDAMALAALAEQQSKGEMGFASEELRKAQKALERALSWVKRA
jgi:hypothetical protein